MEREHYESLDAEEQARVFSESHFRERADLLLHSREPEGLTRSLSPEELYLVTRELAPEERAEVICFATAPQLLFLSDIDCWKKDRISTVRFVRWLETLLEAGDEKLIAWFLEMDYEMLVAALKKVIHVAKPEWDFRKEAAFRDRPYFTLDEYYHIYVKEENLETVKRAIECLYESEHGRYVALLEGVIAELDGEVEENAWRLREMRLAERGFPDAETARRIFQPLSEAEFDAFPRKTIAEARAFGAEKLPDYPQLWSPEKLFLDDALLLLRGDPAAVREHVQEELVWLSNKMIACDGIDFASEERIRAGLERVRGLLNLGLESLAGGDLGRARELLVTRWLEAILRRGFALVCELVRAAEHLCARSAAHGHGDASREAFEDFLGMPYGAVMRGLRQRVPQFYDPDAPGLPEGLRDFRSLADAERTRGALGRLELAQGYLERELGGPLAAFVHAVPGLAALLGTAFAHAAIGEKPSAAPLGPRKLERFLREIFVPQGGRRRVDPAAARRFLDASFSGAARPAAEKLWAEVFEKIEEEFSGLDPSRPVDARFVSALFLEEGARRA